MENLIRTASLTPWLITCGCVFAFFFGAVHSLLPGHGKTVICGYCVGRKRNVAKILFISAVTVITHLFSSALLGAVAMTTSRILVTNIILPRLQMISAAILFIFGAAMLGMRLLRPGGHEHHHEHIHPHEYGHHGEDDDHHDGEEHGHTHGEMDELLHEYAADEHPSFHRYSRLFWLGLAAGLIPCAEPFTLMLFAISLGRIGLGFLLLFCFGLGVFLTLVAVSLLVTPEAISPEHAPVSALERAAGKAAALFKTVYPVLLMIVGAGWLYAAVKK